MKYFFLKIDVATAYKMIPETFNERAVCELAEIQLFPPKPVITITRKYSPYREIITKGYVRIHTFSIAFRSFIIFFYFYLTIEINYIR